MLFAILTDNRQRPVTPPFLSFYVDTTTTWAGETGLDIQHDFYNKDSELV